DRYASEVVKAMKLSGLVPPADVQAMADAFMDKVRQGKERHGKSGFGGKGLEKLDKDRDMVKKIQKVTYGAASGEVLDDDDNDDDDDDEEENSHGHGGHADVDVDSDGEPVMLSGRKEKARDNEIVRRLPATPRSASVAAASPLASNSIPNSPAAHAHAHAQGPSLSSSSFTKQAQLSPKPLSAAVQAAQLAAQAAVRRLNIDNTVATAGVQNAPVLSAVDQINQQLGISAAASRHGETQHSLSSSALATAANSHAHANIAAAASGTAKGTATSSAIAHRIRPGVSAHKEASGPKSQTTTGTAGAGASTGTSTSGAG
ncbi:pre-mRNA processing RNA-helicase, partial [Coemansia erecta]